MKTSRLRLTLLLAPFVAHATGNLVGSTFMPALLARSPLLLIAVSPLIRHLVLASPHLDAPTFYTVGAAAMLYSDPFLYVLGREWGAEAVTWLERRAGMGAGMVRWFDRAFRKAGWLLVLVTPGPLVCALAGAQGMRVLPFVGLNLAGTAGALVLVRTVGAAIEEPLRAVRDFFDEHLGAVSIAFLVVAFLLGLRRQWRQAPPPEGLDLPLDPGGGGVTSPPSVTRDAGASSAAPDDRRP